MLPKHQPWSPSFVLLLGLLFSLRNWLHADSGKTNSTWWSFQPLQRPPVPASGIWHPASPPPANPIDAFINAKLAEKGITPNPPATRRELIRRAQFDLIGLPPTFEEVTAFENDARADAWERLLDRLLARPEYGERWARHWLDVVRYAQSNGYERDGEKLFAWRYRDYVVRAFNDDKPYDRFIREHIAGDELEPWSADAVTATGYARLGVYDDEPDDREMAAFDDLDDVLSTTGVAFLGLTLGCARCHEHKFDPIPHADYYRLLAFFRGVQPMQHITEPAKSTAHIPLATPAEVSAWQAEQAAKVKALDAAYAAAKTDAERKQVAIESEAVKQRPPPFPLVLALRESGAKPEPTHVLKRGNAHSRGEEVHPAFLSAVSPLVQSSRWKDEGTAQTRTNSSGRRLVLADWIASPDNPLTARVIVNRVWHHHFGRGLVKTTGDFGRAGTLPTHPELLDWLASEFVEQGWSLKRLHKLIMTSEAYRRSSVTSRKPEAGSRKEDGLLPTADFRFPTSLDPANELLWRQNLRRLEAETIRDSILEISGRLNRVPGGRGFFPSLSGEVLAGGSRPGTDWEFSSPAEQSRRSLYAYVRRTQPVPFLEALDYANYTAPLTERPTTTVAPQALLLLNDDFMREQAAAFAKRLPKLAAGGGKPEVIAEAYRLALARNPTAREIEVATEFLGRQREHFASLRTRLTFRADVPATMNIAYFGQLQPEHFVVAPPGWTRHRGHWPDSYEGNRIMERANGPFALWPAEKFANATVSARVTLHTAFESGGLLLRATADGDRPRGYEVTFDPRGQRVSLRRLGTNTVTLAEAAASVPTGTSFPVRAEIAGATIRLWLDKSPNPTLVASDPQPLAQPGHLGMRVWGAALGVDDLRLTSGGQEIVVLPGADVSDPNRRALEAFCLLLLNLNEVVYVD